MACPSTTSGRNNRYPWEQLETEVPAVLHLLVGLDLLSHQLHAEVGATCHS